MQLLLAVGTPQDSTVKGAAVGKAVRHTADVHGTALAEVVCCHLHFFVSLHQHFGAFQRINVLLALAKVDGLVGVFQDEVVRVFFPVVLVVVEGEAVFFLHAQHAGKLENVPLIGVAGGLTHADEAAAIPDEPADGRGDLRVFPPDAAGVCGIGIAYIDENIKGTTPYCVKRVAVLNCWGKMRAWGCHMVHHALYYKQNYSYAGVIEMLSGAPFEVKFISFEDIKNDPRLLDSLDVIINVGDADTAHTGGIWWEDPEISSAIRRFVWNGGGFIGVGEPSGHPYQGHIFQLASVLGVEEENGFTLNYDKYNWEEHPDHFILQDADQPVDFGEGKKNIYALEGTDVLVQRNKEVQMAAHDFGKGRAVYISGVPYSFANSRTLYRAILWSAHSEEELHTWFSSNYNVEVHAYVKNGKYCVVNNTYEPQDTTVYTTDGSSFALHLDANEIKWYEI